MAIRIDTLMIYSYGVGRIHTQHDLLWLVSIMSYSDAGQWHFLVGRYQRSTQSHTLCDYIHHHWLPGNPFPQPEFSLYYIGLLGAGCFSGKFYIGRNSTSWIQTWAAWAALISAWRRALSGVGWSCLCTALSAYFNHLHNCYNCRGQQCKALDKCGLY